jgi:uncharacterized protein
MITDISSAVATIRVHVIPNAKIDKVMGEHGDAIKIKLRAPAIEGKANTALRRFLAEQLEIPQRAIALERGERSRDKVIRIDGLSEGDICRRLGIASLEGGATATPPLIPQVKARGTRPSILS